MNYKEKGMNKFIRYELNERCSGKMPVVSIVYRKKTSVEKYSYTLD